MARSKYGNARGVQHGPTGRRSTAPKTSRYWKVPESQACTNPNCLEDRRAMLDTLRPGFKQCLSCGKYYTVEGMKEPICSDYEG